MLPRAIDRFGLAAAIGAFAAKAHFVPQSVGSPHQERMSQMEAGLLSPLHLRSRPREWGEPSAPGRWGEGAGALAPINDYG